MSKVQEIAAKVENFAGNGNKLCDYKRILKGNGAVEEVNFGRLRAIFMADMKTMKQLSTNIIGDELVYNQNFIYTSLLDCLSARWN